ncbi:MAG: two-component regulator propeller domain-containing protein [Bacteroidales bacterium]|nr:two-component regulator propeller domain-containing protein [Bacteroidales bacterium]
MKKLFVIALVFYFPFVAISQVPLGGWREHFSFRPGKKVTASQEKVFTSSDNGVFWYDIADGTIDKLTTVTGLSDIGVSAIGYSPFINLLAVGYENGNIDLVYNDKVVNIPYIMQKPMQGSKQINDFYFIDENRIFISTGFGIVVINVSKNEIADTYYIGNGGSEERVWQTQVYKNRIYAVTDNGVYSADINSPLLILYTNWILEDAIPSVGIQYNTMGVFDGSLIVNQSTGEEVADVIRVFDGEQWSTLNLPYLTVSALTSSGNRLGVCSRQGVALYSNLNGYPEVTTSYPNRNSFKPNDIYIFNSGDLAIADTDYGMMFRQNQAWKGVLPNAPYTNNTYFVLPTSDELLVTAGARTDTWGNKYNNFALHYFAANSWSTKFNYNYMDAVRIIDSPFAPNEYYVATWGDGIVAYRDGVEIEHYSPDNSSLQSIIPGRYCRIGGLAFDKSRNLWATNAGVPNTISVRSPEGNWKGFPYQTLIGSERISDIIVSPSGTLWVIAPSGGGLFVIDPGDNPLSQESHTVRAFKPYDADGASLPNDIYSLAFDRDGYLWVGTTEGVLVSYNPSRVFETSAFYMQKVKIPDVVDGLAVFLLENETVSSIAIDGANRKWFGTQRSGVFLQTADGSTQIKHFTKNNSPLPSNNIQSIGIHPKTGEVFIATDKGLVSYRSDATEPTSKFGKVYAFPNPIRPDYNGIITITGLVDKTVVKITDVSGNLVYETESLGGQATWDGKNRYGDRVATGVYLYFCADKQGEESAVGKILFIR